MDRARTVLAALAVAALVVAIVVGGYLGGWWLKKDATNRRVDIRNQNSGVQTAWRDEAIDLINEIELLPESAPARGALTNQACDLIGRLNDNYRGDARITSFETQECV